MTKEELIQKEFGKSIKEMSKEELLCAITSISNRLYNSTKDEHYKDMEDAFSICLDGVLRGESDKTSVDKAVTMLKGRGYVEPEEEVMS